MKATAAARPQLRGLVKLLPGRRDLEPMRDSWRGDVLAGVTVGIVALPLALAFGASAGLGPAAGLVTAIVAGIVATIFGGSHVQVSGPTGAMVVVLAPIVVEHGARSVALVSLIAGIILIVLGILRLGRAVGVIPWPVIEGFTVGIAIIIAAQQIPAAMGAKAPIGENAVITAARTIAQPGPEVGWTVGVVAIVVAVMVIAPRLWPRLPASLAAVVAATVFAQLADAPIDRIGALPSSLPSPSVSGLDPALMYALLPAAFAVAALSAIESLLSAKVAGTMADVGEFEPDRELVGQGLASMAAGAFGGMPATGAIARTAVNVNSGGRSRIAALTHSAVLAVVVFALAGLVSQIPLAALAGVLLVVSTNMVNLSAVLSLLRATHSAAAIFVTTALITVAFDLVEAVMIGVLIAAFFALRQVASASEVQRDPLPGPAEHGDERIALLTFNGPVFFAAADKMAESILSSNSAEVVILRLSQLTFLDATGAHTLAELVGALERRGVTVLIKGIRHQDRALSDRTGLTGALRHKAHLFEDLDAAVEHARSHIRRSTSTRRFEADEHPHGGTVV